MVCIHATRTPCSLSASMRRPNRFAITHPGPPPSDANPLLGSVGMTQPDYI